MSDSRSYNIAFCIAIILHLSIMGLLLSEHSNQRPVLIAEVKNEPGHMQPQAVMPSEQQPIQAVSMDSQEVMQTVNRLKDERQQQQRAEESRQHALTMQAERVKKLRIEEARRLQQLKREAAELAILQKKQRIEEQEHLKKLAQEKLAQEKRIAEMKQQQLNMQKQQQKEAQKLAEMTRKKKDELAQASAELAKKKADEQAHINQANAAKAKADLLQKQQVAAENAANTARIAGEVDKYKALIINAISQQWILPQNADSTLSSQFRIRLAPNGAVLEVSLTRSSGDSILDRSAQSAIYKASPLPVPHDATAFNVFRDITLTVRPVNARG